ncbi:MAG: tetratricopeptide repeat protein [Bacteroidales bacterium]|nr:tetratricopeptide repeat protein [Bacteroidales bacterium]
MNRFVVLFFFLVISSFCYSQNNKVDSILQKINNAKHDTTKIKGLIKISETLYNSNPDSSVYYISLAQNLSAELIKSSDIIIKEKGIYLHAKALYKSAYFLSGLMKYEKSGRIFRNSIKELNVLISKTDDIKLKSASKYLKANNLSGIADIYLDKGNHSTALEYYIKSQEIIDNLIKIGFLSERETAGLYFHIGMVHFELNNIEKSLNYYEKSLKVSIEFNDKLGAAKCNNNIGIIKLRMNKADEALAYFQKTLTYVVENNILIMQAQVYDNMAECYIRKKEYNKAELYLAKALIITNNLGNRQGEIYVSLGLANLYSTTNKFDKALFYCNRAIEISKEIGAISLEKNAYKQTFEVYEKKKDYKKALFYHKKYKSFEDTLFNKEKNRQIEETEAKYQANKRQAEIDNHKLEIAKKDARLKQKKYQTVAFIILTIVLLIFILVIFISLKHKQRATGHIKKQNKKITDSIEYAKKIQNAAMPSETYMKQIFEDYFVLFKPLQIVSGDFYWAMKKDSFLAFAAADCTGHGVPGAFVSMFGISLLNELSLNSDLKRPDYILEEMRFFLKKSLSQTGEIDEQTDGIDIALCVIDYQSQKLYFAGANQPGYLMRKGKITELIPVMNPVGIYPKEIPFKLQTYSLEEDDIIYLFSDGYADQFGGSINNPKKYTIQRFKRLLEKIYTEPLEKQKEILDIEFNNRKKTNKQIDDVLVFGMKY